MKIIQQTNMNDVQTMGYVFIADSGHVLVVDGGYAGNGGELRRIIEHAGGHVHLWLLTHPHIDHYTAVIDIFSDPKGINYDAFGASRLSDEWGETLEEVGETKELRDWNAFAKTLDERYFEMQPGQKFELGSMMVEIIAAANPDITENPLNNQSCVFRVTEGDFSMLMLGDLGKEAGQRLLETGIDLRADAVQMAHHGQNGVDEEFYKAVSAKYAFWPTPDWLWDNLLPNTNGEPGHFKTLETRAWMKKLNTINITCMEHSVVFDTVTRTAKKF